MRRFVLVGLVIVLAVVGFTRLEGLGGDRATTAGTVFSDTFDGAPSGPQAFTTSSRWDIAVHARDNRTSMPSVNAHHGGDCGPFPATHTVSSHSGSVFQCRDHLMSTLRADGYGAIYLTPNHMADWSQEEAVIRFDLSSFRSSGRDWWDVWLTPLEDNVQLPMLDWLPDVQGPPRRSLQIMHQLQEPTLCATLYDNWRDTNSLNRDNTGCINKWYTENPAFPGVSATRRDTYEIRVTRTHLKVWMPQYNHVFIDKTLDQPLNFTRAVVQLGHHSYSPEKAQITDYPYNTWHWDNIRIEPAVPFSIIRADRRYVDGGTTNAINFAGAAPANSFLRFSAWSVTDVSFDNGATWQPARKVPQPMNDASHIYNYWHPMPAGVSRVLLRSTAKQLGVIDWHAKDFAIWSSSTGPIPTIPLPTAPPVGTPPPATPPAGTPPPPPPPAIPVKVTSSVQFQPANPQPGQNVTVTGSISLDQTMNAAVVVEIYDAKGGRLDQRVFDNEAFTANVKREFTTTGVVPAQLPPGTRLTIAIGVFTPGRTTLLNWNAAAGSVTIGGGAPAPTATPTPKPPSSPTATATPKPPSSPTATATPKPPTEPSPTATPKPPTATPKPPTTPTFQSGVRFSPNPVRVGQTVTAAISLSSSQEMRAVVTFEIYDPSGKRLLSRDFDNVELKADGKQALTTSLPVPAGTPAGAYKVKIGIYTPGKTQRLHWNDNAGTLNITK